MLWTSATCALAALHTACGSPAAPSRGSASISITGASVENGDVSFSGFGLDVMLTLQATGDLLEANRGANPYIPPGRLPFYLCLSADGIHFTSQCQAGVGIGNVEARVVGPPETSFPVTTHLIAFVIPPAEYGTPVTAFVRFGQGSTVPPSALAVHVLPWVIRWQTPPATR